MQVSKSNTETIVRNMRAEGEGSRADYLELMQLELDLIESLCDQTIDELNIQQGDFGIEYSTASPAKSVASVILWLRTVKRI